MADSPPIVEMKNISISFPGVKALDGVDFRLFPGEVHTLMGENGAGKSTLIKALTGVYAIDAGTVTIDGERHEFSSPAASQAATRSARVMRPVRSDSRATSASRSASLWGLVAWAGSSGRPRMSRRRRNCPSLPTATMTGPSAQGSTW